MLEWPFSGVFRHDRNVQPTSLPSIMCFCLRTFLSTDLSLKRTKAKATFLSWIRNIYDNSITYIMFAYNVRWTSQLITHVNNQKVTIAFFFVFFYLTEFDSVNHMLYNSRLTLEFFVSHMTTSPNSSKCVLSSATVVEGFRPRMIRS